MPNEKIVEYYLLCSLGTGKIPHPVNNLSVQELESLLSAKEQEEFLKSLNGKLVANELVIGGDDDISQFILNPHGNKTHYLIDPFQSKFHHSAKGGVDEKRCLIIL